MMTSPSTCTPTTFRPRISSSDNLALMALSVRPEPAGAFYTAMSFDDVAQRMQQRDSTHPLTGVGPASALPTVDQYYVEMAAAERRSRKQKDIVLGSILLGVGLLITLGTYGSASQSGGTYFIAYGPMIVGVIRLFRGLAG